MDWLVRPGEQTARLVIATRDRAHSTVNSQFRGDIILPDAYTKNLTGYVTQGKSVAEGEWICCGGNPSSLWLIRS